MKPDKLNEEKVWQDEDISFQTPELTAEQRDKNLSAFGELRRSTKSKVSEEEKLKLKFLRLKHEMNVYLRAQQSDYRFSSFLAFYIDSLDMSGKTFAEEIKIKPSVLSSILHNRREPNNIIMVRLEIHSNNNFPAFLWCEVLAKQKSLELKNDQELRKKEMTNVKRKVAVVI